MGNVANKKRSFQHKKATSIPFLVFSFNLLVFACLRVLIFHSHHSSAFMKPGVRLDQTVQVAGVTARRSPRPFFYLRFDLDNSLLAHPADLFLHYVNRC